MYVAVIPNRGSPPAILLRESYREAGKTKNRTLANLSGWPAERIAQLRAVLRGDQLLPATEAVDKLKQRFQLQRVVMVGDRGLLTSARIEQTLRPAGLDWITALRAPAIKQLAAAGGRCSPSLFDHRDMAEITSPDYPGERLVVCKNPLLAEERARKRAELLAVTKKELARIAARVQRARGPLRGAAAIGQAVGAVLGRRHMAKHFQISIADDAFSFAKNSLSIAAEAALDG